MDEDTKIKKCDTLFFGENINSKDNLNKNDQEPCDNISNNIISSYLKIDINNVSIREESFDTVKCIVKELMGVV